MKRCSVKDCKNKTFSRALLCPTHGYRRRKGISIDLPIQYLKHGWVGTSTYRSWSTMKNRCLNPKTADFKFYGGRGITVCARWLDFNNFLKDMGEKPSKNFSIDRINNSKGYSLKNCKWATRKEQRRNTRYTLLNAEKASAIRRKVRAGATQLKLAKIYGVAPTTINAVVKNRTWV